MIRSFITILVFLGINQWWYDFNKISYIHSHIEIASDNYFEQKPDQVIESLTILKDSLGFVSPGLDLNMAHAYYKKGRFGNMDILQISEPDSSYLASVQQNLDLYTLAWSAEKTISSIAYNQYGVLVFKTGIQGGKVMGREEIIENAIQYFRSALMQDYQNEEARYNYELLVKYKEFPEMLINRVKNLVSQRKYVEAVELLNPWVEKDRRFKDYADYADRLNEIVVIVSNISES